MERMKMKTTVNTKFITRAAVIAALYVVLTLTLSFNPYKDLQLRISEALTILPFFTPAAIPGLVVGCAIANLFSPLGWVDIVFGSSASLIAALLTYKTSKKYLAPLPPILVNAVIIGLELYFVLDLPLVASMGWVALGQTIACYGLGYPLLLLLSKHKESLFE